MRKQETKQSIMSSTSAFWLPVPLQKGLDGLNSRAWWSTEGHSPAHFCRDKLCYNPLIDMYNEGPVTGVRNTVVYKMWRNSQQKLWESILHNEWTKPGFMVCWLWKILFPLFYCTCACVCATSCSGCQPPKNVAISQSPQSTTVLQPKIHFFGSGCDSQFACFRCSCSSAVQTVIFVANRVYECTYFSLLVHTKSAFSFENYKSLVSRSNRRGQIISSPWSTLEGSNPFCEWLELLLHLNILVQRESSRVARSLFLGWKCAPFPRSNNVSNLTLGSFSRRSTHCKCNFQSRLTITAPGLSDRGLSACQF